MNNKITKLIYALLLFILIPCKQVQSYETDKKSDINHCLRHPLGDNQTEVYPFIVDFVKQYSPWSRRQAVLANEEYIKNKGIEDLKPQIDVVFESQMSHILMHFCKDSECRSLSLYARNGQIIAFAADYPEINVDFIIEDELYQRYKNGVLTKPHTKAGETKTISPIYSPPESSEASHNKDEVEGLHESEENLVGFIAYERKSKCSR